MTQITRTPALGTASLAPLPADRPGTVAGDGATGSVDGSSGRDSTLATVGMIGLIVAGWTFLGLERKVVARPGKIDVAPLIADHVRAEVDALERINVKRWPSRFGPGATVAVLAGALLLGVTAFTVGMANAEPSSSRR